MNTVELLKDAIEYEAENYLSADEQDACKLFIETLQSNDESKIAWYTQFGSTPRQILMNECTYLKLIECGFEGFELNKYGWIEENKRNINIINKVEFTTGKEHFVKNYYEVGQLPNGKFVHGLWYDLGGNGGGGVRGISIWNNQYNTQEECESEALNFFKVRFEESVMNNQNNAYCKKILVEINKHDPMINPKNKDLEIKELRPIQLQLFS